MSHGLGCPAEPIAGESATDAAATGQAAGEGRHYLFRGDDAYRGGPVGRTLGSHADTADIQDFAEHVLRKESQFTSRYVSFSEVLKIARKFTSSSDNRHVRKVDVTLLQELEANGVIRIWYADQVYAVLRASGKKLARQAADVRTAMRRNGEVLIEGQIPSAILERTS